MFLHSVVNLSYKEHGVAQCNEMKMASTHWSELHGTSEGDHWIPGQYFVSRHRCEVL